MKTLSKQEVKEVMTLHLQKWALEKDTLKRDFKFNSFVEAFSFMTAIALEAEKINHHPDWSNSYDKVLISLTTHEANGLTQRDFDLANTIDEIYENKPF